jgi:hypothetical protein
MSHRSRLLRLLAVLSVAAAVVSTPGWASAHGGHGGTPAGGGPAVVVVPATSGVSATVSPSGEVTLTSSGRAVVVGGLYGEPYLRILPDGSTWSNLRSRTSYEMFASGYTVAPPVDAMNFNPEVDAPAWVPRDVQSPPGTLRWFDLRARPVETHGHAATSVEATDMAVDIVVLPDPESGYNLTVLTEGFTWSPQGVSRPDVFGEGHAHLYVDGEKTARLYGPDHHLQLDPGGREVKVVLSTNSHSVYTRSGVPLESSVHVLVPQRPGAFPDGLVADAGPAPLWAIPILVDGTPASIAGFEPAPAAFDSPHAFPWWLPASAVSVVCLAVLAVAVVGRRQADARS